HRGPRAVLNALARLADSYPDHCAATQQDLAIAEGQRRDYEARIGHLFPHDAYLAALTDLRNQLKAGLSASQHEPTEGKLPVSELADRIKALKAAHTIDGTPERTVARLHLAGEVPVTTRIRRRNEGPATNSGPAFNEPTSIAVHQEAASESDSQSRSHAIIHLADDAEDRMSEPTTQQERRYVMGRSKNKPAESAQDMDTSGQAAKDAAPPSAVDSTQAGHDLVSTPDRPSGQEIGAEPRKPIVTPDPRPVMSISLGDTRGSPRVQLRRSHKYRQMQIYFEQRPEDKYLLMLKHAGWIDRTESEGVWTKQIAPDARWQSVDKMEREFKEVVNAIRQDKGIEPVMAVVSIA
ncbi:hypothetical protein ACYOEI_28785, partial [Singulisphaera rosea]